MNLFLDSDTKSAKLFWKLKTENIPSEFFKWSWARIKTSKFFFLKRSSRPKKQANENSLSLKPQVVNYLKQHNLTSNLLNNLNFSRAKSQASQLTYSNYLSLGKRGFHVGLIGAIDSLYDPEKRLHWNISCYPTLLHYLATVNARDFSAPPRFST